MNEELIKAASSSPHWLEMVYWVAGVAVALFAGLSLRQLTILKSDISTRNERASKEKALDAAKTWADAQEHLRTFISNCNSAQLPNAYSGPITDFFLDSLPENLKSVAIAKEKIHGWAKPINQFEAIAAMFTKGVADEQTGFEIIGRDYCLCVGALYDVLAASRLARTQPLYSNIVELYTLWSVRLAATELIDKKTEADAKLANLKPKSIQPIGVVEPNKKSW